MRPLVLLAAVFVLAFGSAPDARGAGWGGSNKRDKGKWEVWEDCTLRESSANDGDSFYVFAPKFKTKTAQERKLRLYFCDTPENEEDLEARIEDQRKHWDLADAATVLKLGREAANFTKRFLSRGFTVYTKREDALGRGKPRIAVMVMVNGEDLALTLVRNGYARIGSFKTDLSNVPEYEMSQAKFMKMLQEAEFKAKEEGRGCWAESGKNASGPARFVRSAATAPSGVRERATGYVHGDARRAAESRSVAGRTPTAERTAQVTATAPATTLAPRSDSKAASDAIAAAARGTTSGGGPGRAAPPAARGQAAAQQAAKPLKPLATNSVIVLEGPKSVGIYRAADASNAVKFLRNRQVTFLGAVSRTRGRISFVNDQAQHEVGFVELEELGLFEPKKPLVADAQGGPWGTFVTRGETPLYRMGPDGRPQKIATLPKGKLLRLRGNANAAGTILRVSMPRADGSEPTALLRRADMTPPQKP